MPILHRFLLNKTISKTKRNTSTKNQYLSCTGETFAITALKRSKFSDKVVVRGFNMSSHLEKLQIEKKWSIWTLVESI